MSPFYQMILCLALIHMIRVNARPCDEDQRYEMVNGMCLLTSTTQKLSWFKANDFCASNDGILVNLEEPNQYEDVKSWLLNDSPDRKAYWIGLSRIGGYKNFTWSDSREVASYTDWLSNEEGPTNLEIAHSCVMIYKSNLQGFKWMIVHCDVPSMASPICQLPRSNRTVLANASSPTHGSPLSSTSSNTSVVSSFSASSFSVIIGGFSAIATTLPANSTVAPPPSTTSLLTSMTTSTSTTSNTTMGTTTRTTTTFTTTTRTTTSGKDFFLVFKNKKKEKLEKEQRNE